MDLEVYVSGPAGKALAKGGGGKYNDLIDLLTCDGISVKTALGAAEEPGAQALLKARGPNFEEPHDAFMRLALEGATVFSF